MQKSILFTQSGYSELQEEYADLLAHRPEAVKDLSKAREMGDLSENGYYKSARMKLSQVDRRIREVKHLLKVAKVKPSQQNGIIDIGSKVTLEINNQTITYDIVGTYEANPSQRKISLSSPLGKALEGKRAGETAILQRNENTFEYTVKLIT